MRSRRSIRITTQRASSTTGSWRLPSGCLSRAGPTRTATQRTVSRLDRSRFHRPNGNASGSRGIAMPGGEPLVELRAVRKDYRGLRPLRVEHLDVHEGQSIALLGFDQAGAEVLVN